MRKQRTTPRVGHNVTVSLLSALFPLITRLTSTEVEWLPRANSNASVGTRMTPNAGGSSSDAALVYNEAPWVRKRVVGRGNFGKARLLENVDTGELVVSKEAKLEGSEEARRKQSSDWSKEVELHSQLVHPHIIGYRGSFQKNDMFCIVMDYEVGGDLYTRVARARKAGQGFPEGQVLEDHWSSLFQLSFFSSFSVVFHFWQLL